MTHTYFAPLLAFNYEGDSIELTSDLVIDELTDVERDLAEHQGVRVPLAEHCIRLTTAGIGQPPGALAKMGAAPDPGRPGYLDAVQRVRDVACGLRLYKAGHFDATYIVEYRDEGEPRGVSFDSQPLDWPLGYDLEPDEGSGFAGFWEDIQAGFNCAWLKYALKRFDLATSRHSREDSLIDLAICGEAIFLQGDARELSYRLALSCAFFLSTTPAGRQSIYDAVRRAYDARSLIVHGELETSCKRLTKLARKGGLEGRQPHEIVGYVADEFEDLMRQSLLKVMRYSRNHPGPPDWNGMVMQA